MDTASLPISGIVSRRLLDVALDRLKDEPVIALQGPRTVGKSTLLAELARACNAELIDLDSLSLRAAVSADPGAFVSGPYPICIDEYQHVPALLDAIKAELNRDLRPGRFVIAGSARYDALPVTAQSLTGRMHSLPVWPLSQREIDGAEGSLLEALLDGAMETVPRGTVSAMTKDEYVARIAAGGMPIALARRSPAARNRWFDDYVELVLERDVRELSRLRQREQMPALLNRLAAQTGQVLNITSAAAGAGLERTTGADYLKLLEAVFLVTRLPAWGTTVRARAANAPKIHVVDSGLAARLLHLTPEKLAARDPASFSQFGHLLETFVVGELLRQASWIDEIAACGHWRTYDGDEVDLVVERSDGRVLAFEVKASGQVVGADARHLDKLRDAIGDRFVAGLALYTGTTAYQLGDRVYAMPIDRIWAPVEAIDDPPR